jgi:peroxiredoxin Q/BCP
VSPAKRTGGAAVREGAPAPDFSLPDHSGRPVRLSDLRGRTVILYFYPEDDTPACTAEACDFRDLSTELAALGAVVVGVSPQGAESHEAFRAKHGLPFALLADVDRKVASRWGAWGEKILYGRKVEGLIRSTFVIGPDGRVVAALRNVKAKGHAGRVLALLKAASSRPRTAARRRAGAR